MEVRRPVRKPVPPGKRWSWIRMVDEEIRNGQILDLF